jgi:hypothetical protein
LEDAGEIVFFPHNFSGVKRSEIVRQSVWFLGVGLHVATPPQDLIEHPDANRGFWSLTPYAPRQ